MTDIINLITGLEASLKEHQDKKDLFIKAKGLHEEEEKIRQEVGVIRSNLEVEKMNLKALVDVKNLTMMSVTAAMAKTMNDLLAGTTAIIEIKEDGTVNIGMFNGKVNVPYSGLSGGEKAAFDPALCRALGGSILLVEAAELDPKRLTAALEKYGTSDLQVIISTCHAPETMPAGWEVISL
jgi:hypothetical protein